jgi:hypothetical protein
MHEPEFRPDRATPEQMERLRRLGYRSPDPVSRALADILIRTWSATPRQLDCLAGLGVYPDGPITRKAASDLIERTISLRRRLPPTPRQESFLRARGLWREGLTRGEASDLIGKVKAGEG